MEDLAIQPGVVIPGHELEVATSRAGGPGGQHVNTTATRITLRWNVRATAALDSARRDRLIARLGKRVTADGDVLVNVASSRSQSQNRSEALERLAEIVRKALVERKKRARAGLPALSTGRVPRPVGAPTGRAPPDHRRRARARASAPPR